MNEDIHVKVDAELKRRAIFVAKGKGKNLTQVVEEALKKYADNFEKIK